MIKENVIIREEGLGRSFEKFLSIEIRFLKTRLSEEGENLENVVS